VDAPDDLEDGEPEQDETERGVGQGPKRHDEREDRNRISQRAGDLDAVETQLELSTERLRCGHWKPVAAWDA